MLIEPSSRSDPHHRLRDRGGMSSVVLTFSHTHVSSLQLGLASDLVRDINRSYYGFATFIRPRTRYLVFCSSWTLLSGIFLVMLMALAEFFIAIVVQLIVYVQKFFCLPLKCELTTGPGCSCPWPFGSSGPLSSHQR